MFISLKMVLIGIDPYPYANRPSWHFIIFFGCLLWQWLRNCPIWRGLAGERVHEVFSESCVNPNQMFHSLLLPCATLLYFNGQGPCRPCMHSHKHPLRKGVCCVWGGSYCILFATHPPISTSSSCFYYLRCYKKVIFACKWSALKCSPIFFAVLWLILAIFSPGSPSLCVLTSWIPAGISTCLEAAASFGCCSGPMDGEPWRTHGVVIEGYGMILDTPLQWLRKYEKIMKYLSKLA